MTTVPVTIYAEMTPNPGVMKFVANKVLNAGSPVDFTTSSDVSTSPIAAKLLNFPFVEAVFIANNYVSVTKNHQIEWDMVMTELREFIRDFINDGGAVLTEVTVKETTEKPAAISEPLNVATTEIDQKIIDALNEYIRPAVESDGGSIDFRSFVDGKVNVVLRGACSGCPSSTVTLKQGIEGLLKKLVPEVQEVVSEAM
ncbi:MAG: NifU family protein [Bacteroidetes bacterium]|nr:NifU family protein [Bacteroidota bacterium]